MHAHIQKRKIFIMSNKLKIYACSGVGNAEHSNTPIAYWTDNTNTISNTQAINTLLARINLLNISMSRLQGVTPGQRIEYLNNIDMLCVCLDAAKRFKDDSEGLEYAGGVIYKMVVDGMFEFDNLNTNTRDTHLDELIAYANEQYNDRTPIANINPEFMQWWNETVVSRNKVGLNFVQQQNARRALKKSAETIKGIGASDAWKSNEELAEMLTNSGTYFLYTYFTADQLKKLPRIFAERRINQLKTYNYCKSMFVGIFGSEEEMQDVIRAGIINEFGEEPESVCEDVVSGKRQISGISSLTVTAIVTIVTAVLSFLGTLITSICDCIKETNIAKYGALDKEVIEEGVPNPEDFDRIKFDGDKKENSKLLTIAAIAAGLLLLLNK